MGALTPHPPSCERPARQLLLQLCRRIKFSLFSSRSYRVSPADLSDLHVICYELERDLMPLILSNTQYSIERGQETLPEHDLAKIQQQLISRFLLGKPLITLEVSGGAKLRSFTGPDLKILNVASALFPTEDSNAS